MMYKSRNWRAVERTDLVGSNYTLTVTGEVQVLRSNEDPKLAEHHPQGINPRTLILALTVTTTSPLGGDVVTWKPVEYVHNISPRQYQHVTVIGQTEETTVLVDVSVS